MTASAAAADGSSQRRTRVGAGAVVASALVATAAAWWLLRPADTGSAAKGQGAVAAAASAPVAIGGTSGPVVSPPVQGPVAATPPPAAGVAPAAAAFSVLGALQDLVAHADPAIQVSSRVDQPSLVIERDALRFRVSANEAGYLYVFFAGTDKRHFHLLFPNRLDRANRIEPGAELRLPRKGWEITAAGPPGTNHLVVLVSRHERDLSRAGLRSTDEPIPEFDLAEAERLWRQRAPATNPFAGVPVCVTPGCPDAYGATMLTVDEVAAPAKARN